MASILDVYNNQAGVLGQLADHLATDPMAMLDLYERLTSRGGLGAYVDNQVLTEQQRPMEFGFERERFGREQLPAPVMPEDKMLMNQQWEQQLSEEPTRQQEGLTLNPPGFSPQQPVRGLR